MRDKLAGIIFIPLIILPIAYVVFDVIKIIAMILFPSQIYVSEYVREMGGGWVIDPEKDLWGIFIVWIILSIFTFMKIQPKNENK